MFQESHNPFSEALAPEDDVSSTQLRLELLVSDPEVIAFLEGAPSGRHRGALALEALKIGVLAMRQAQGQVDAQRVRNEGERLIATLDGALGRYREGVAGDIDKALKDYFDPKDGRFSERVERLIAKDGELEKALRAQVEGDGSVLAKTLSGHLGPDSPIMKVVDPNAEKGLARTLATAVERAAIEQRDAILREFSLDHADGALARTVRELTEKHGAAGEALEQKIAGAVAEFSLDKEDSALSRLVRRVDAAQAQMSDELSLDKEGSALGRIRKEMLEQIDGLTRRNSEFQHEVIERLTEMAARKAEALKSTTHGNDFETALLGHINEMAQKAGDVATPTGSKTGFIQNCKIGDCVLELGPEHAAAGARIVIEAKQSASYTLAKAREEMDTARKNRRADIGVFVFSRRTAPAGLDPFLRLGSDIFVIWDQDDVSTDVYLKAGLSVARALVTAASADTGVDEADLDAMERAIRSVEKQLKGLAEIDGWAANVIRDGGKIADRSRKMTTALEREIGNLDQGLRELRSGA